MNLFQFDTIIDFIKLRKFAFAISGILIVLSIASLAYQSLNFGIDFTGGTLIHVVYEETADVEGVRTSLQNNEFSNAIVKSYGSSFDVEIRIPPQDGMDRTEVTGKVMSILKSDVPNVSMLRQDFVGPQVGEKLAEQGTLAMIYALIGILLYVSVRFQFKFSAAAVLALVHDVIITLGIFSIFRFDFDLSVLAALLAIIGYSLNDTIVIFDRIRENFRKLRDKTPVEVVNLSINQTISRTLMTSLTTMIVLVCLFFLGGSGISFFALAMIVGVMVGTYSSIFLATNITLALGVTKQDLVVQQKEIVGDGSQV